MTSWREWARAHMTGAMNLSMPSFTAGGDDLDEAGVRHDVRQAKAHGFFATLCTAEAQKT
jgi:4-hydroxy-tetrahydrodipicolinate synthase